MFIDDLSIEKPDLFDTYELQTKSAELLRPATVHTHLVLPRAKVLPSWHKNVFMSPIHAALTLKYFEHRTKEMSISRPDEQQKAEDQIYMNTFTEHNKAALLALKRLMSSGVPSKFIIVTRECLPNTMNSIKNNAIMNSSRTLLNINNEVEESAVNISHLHINANANSKYVNQVLISLLAEPTRSITECEYQIDDTKIIDITPKLKLF